jgi:hypothetical protein
MQRLWAPSRPRAAAFVCWLLADLPAAWPAAAWEEGSSPSRSLSQASAAPPFCSIPNTDFLHRCIGPSLGFFTSFPC